MLPGIFLQRVGLRLQLRSGIPGRTWLERAGEVDDEERLPKIIFLDLNGEIRPSIKLFHRKFISDLNYSVQSSHDLKNWNAIWSTSDGKSSPLITDLKEDGIFSEITILNPVKEEAKSQQFFRVLTDYIGAN